MPIFIGAGLLLAVAFALGRLCLLVKQPPIAGHMLAGVVLGPSLLNVLTPSHAFGIISNISIFVVVITAGLEVRLQPVIATFTGKNGFSVLLPFAIPALLAGAISVLFAIPPLPSLIVALCVAVTALPVALQILNTFGLLNSRLAAVSISGALLTDILVFAAIGVVISANGEGRWLNSIGLALLRMLGLIASIVVAQVVTAQLIRRLKRSDETHDPVAQAVILVFALLFVLGLAAVSELLGFHFAIGAFFAAMMITPELIGPRVFDRLNARSEMFTALVFGPLFLGYQGVQFELSSLTRPAFMLTLIVAAVLAKLAGGYYFGRLQNLSSREAFGVGIVMNARGVMELVAASIAFHAALIDASVFSALLLVGLVTTAMTPVMLQRWQKGYGS